MNLESDEIKIDIIRYKNEGLSNSKIAKLVGCHQSTISRFLNKKTGNCWWQQNQKPIASGEKNDHHEDIKKFGHGVYIITSAQNSTFVHDDFLKSLKQFSRRYDAKIIIGTFSYNLNGFQKLEKGDGEWFDPKITEYVLDEPAQLAEDLLWCGELNILPTAVNPLSGFHSYTKSSSGIIPHAKLQLQSLPRHPKNNPKILYTTGCVTKRNYIKKKAGQKASFHHIYGALVVEVEKSGDWFVRQVVWDEKTGGFYDLDTLYKPHGWFTNQKVTAINWGDIHSEKIDYSVAMGSFISSNISSESLLDFLKPKYQFCHDIIDFRARNHHNIKDPYFRFKMHNDGIYDSVKNDIDDVCKILMEMNRPWCEIIVVESNHDLALKRWLKESDYKNDPENAIIFLELQLEMYKAIQGGIEDFSIFECAIKNNLDSFINVKFLKKDETFKICENFGGIECGYHGDIGNNGSRGNANSFIKNGTRHNIGHSHSASIIDGVYQSGHMMDEKKIGYTSGPTSWSHSHIITYENGKRTIVTMRNQKYRGIV